ncbi:EAL domain-containing protein [Acidiferrobacter sp.]|uniref:EAL domain-containing protein n=1 Tax=Acidiferrobacter sp. TaxID=1872107 RepID=UPI00262AE532|nr:EAL domain-containing protein [Acidiferrobacter sp.]
MVFQEKREKRQGSAHAGNEETNREAVARFAAYPTPHESGVNPSSASLKAALAAGSIQAAYQPIVALDTGAIVAEESLARWVVGDGTLIPAGAFIDTAAASGVLAAIDEVVLNQTLDRCHRRQTAGLPPRLHFVNISTALLCAPDRLARIVGVVAACGTPLATDDPRLRSLIVEVTERELVPHLPTLARELDPLLGAGVRLALDDFGSGYSSFLYLADLPITFLKIEQALVARAGRDKRADAIIRSIGRLAEEIGIIAIAEGIESAASAQAVAALGITWGQGYHFGRPTQV